MTPEEITKELNEIGSNIAYARTLIARLSRCFEVAARENQAVDVVYSDIWADADLANMHTTLKLFEGQLDRAQNITLPEHFDRLRSGTP